MGPPPCLAKLSVPNSYNHNIPHPHHCNFISVCTAAGCLYYLYMFILTLFPVRLLLLFFEFVFYLSIKFSFWFCSLLNFLRLYGSYLRKVSFFHTSLGQIIYITYVKSISINFEPQYLEAKRTSKKASDMNNSQSIMQINDSSNNLRKRYVVYFTEMYCTISNRHCHVTYFLK